MATTSQPPATLSPRVVKLSQVLPAELLATPRFVLWRWLLRDKWTKPPYQPGGRLAKADDSSTWSTFAEVVAAYEAGGFAGIGVVTNGDGLVGVDFDHCRDSESGLIADWALAPVQGLNSYTEVSPSGSGLRVLAYGALPAEGRSKSKDGHKIEVYESGRYLTLSGHDLEGFPERIEERREVLVRFHAWWFGTNGSNGSNGSGPKEEPRSEVSGKSADDEELLRTAREAKNGAQFRLLYDHGDTKGYGDDQNRADMALACHLVYWSNRDASRADRLFRRSRLMRDKWEERHYANGETYGDHTIAQAMGIVREGWQPGGEIRHGSAEKQAENEESSSEPYALSLDEFIARKNSSAPPLLGTEEDNILPAGALALLVGKGGKGKTTLIMDAAFHLASGLEWLEFPVQRPLRILVIENEGPIEPFRRKLEAKRKSWEHPIRGALFVKTFNWGAFTVDEQGERDRLRAFIEEHQIDLVIGDPLDSLGIKGVGSPADTREFMAQLVQVGLTRDVAFWLLHHPTKAEVEDELDEASGAWGGRPDTMFRLALLPGSRSRLSFPKVRWGAISDRPAYILAFDQETGSFSLVAKEGAQERDLFAEIQELLTDGEFRTAKEISASKQPKDAGPPGIGANVDAIKKVLESNPDTFTSFSGALVRRSSQAVLWRLLTTKPPTDSDPLSQSSQSGGSGGGKGGTDSRTPTYRRSRSPESVQPPGDSDLSQSSRVGPESKTEGGEAEDFSAAFDVREPA